MEILKDIIVEGKHGKPVLLDVFFENSNSPKPIIIFSHGFKGFKNWGHWDLVAKEFAKCGYLFVKFNFSHNGTTPAHPEDFVDLEAFGNNNFSIELDDLGCVIEWILDDNNTSLIQKTDKDNIFLIGHSRGGGTTILKANEDKRVKKIVTWASVSEFGVHWTKEVMEQWKKNGVIYIENARTKQQMPLYYQLIQDHQNNIDRLHIPGAAKNLKIPFLIIHGEKDISVPIKEAENLNSWSKTASLIKVPEANHTFGGVHPYERKELPEQTQIAINHSIEFLKRKLPNN